MMSREAKLRSAIVSLESTTLHRRHHLNSDTFGKGCRPVRPRQHRLIQRHRDTPVREAQRLQQSRDSGPVVDLDLLLIHHDDHGTAPTGASSDTICSAVHGANRNPDRP